MKETQRRESKKILVTFTFGDTVNNINKLDNIFHKWIVSSFFFIAFLFSSHSIHFISLYSLLCEKEEEEEKNA